MDHWEKLEWAGKHLDILEHDIRAFIDSKPYSIDRDFDPQERKGFARLIEVKPIPFRDWSLRLGDIIHNLRSSLDSLVYALAVKARGSATFTHDEILRMQFPICDDPLYFFSPTEPKNCEKWRRIRTLCADAQADIETLQPYRGSYPKGLAPLSALRDIANVEKHRHLIPTAMIAVRADLVIGDGTLHGIETTARQGRIVDKAIVAWWQFPDGLPHPEVDVQCNVAAEVRFQYGDPPRNGHAFETPRDIYKVIKSEVFPLLDKRFA